MTKFNFYLVSAISFFLFFHETSVCDEKKIAFVKKGAFVVPNDPNTELREHQTRLRVGYLPVGTLVWVGECFSLNENASSGIPEEKEYCSAKSEVGVNGLIRKDLIHFFTKPVIVALSNEEIKVYPQNGGKPYSNFSRNSGVYVNVIGSIDNGEIPVMRHYTKPKPIPGILKIEQLGEKVRYLDPGKLKANKVEVQSLSQYADNFVKIYFGEEINSYFSRIKGALDKIEKELQSSSSLCQVGGKVFAEVGLKFFGNGAGAEIEAILKKPGETFGFDASVLSVGGDRTVIASINRYACTSPPGSVPERLTEFLSVGAPQGNPEEILRIKGDQQKQSLYVVRNNPKMLKIRKWEDYEKYYSTLRREVRQMNFVRFMGDQEEAVYIHYILSKVADYQSL